MHSFCLVQHGLAQPCEGVVFEHTASRRHECRCRRATRLCVHPVRAVHRHRLRHRPRLPRHQYSARLRVGILGWCGRRRVHLLGAAAVGVVHFHQRQLDLGLLQQPESDDNSRRPLRRVGGQQQLPQRAALCHGLHPLCRLVQLRRHLQRHDADHHLESVQLVPCVWQRPHRVGSNAGFVAE